MSFFSQFTLKTVAIKVWFKSFYWNCNHKLKLKSITNLVVMNIKYIYVLNIKSYAQWKFCFILDCVCVCMHFCPYVWVCVFDHIPISLVISKCFEVDPHIYIWISCEIQNTEIVSNPYQWIWWLYEMLNSPLKTCFEGVIAELQPVLI